MKEKNSVIEREYEGEYVSGKEREQKKEAGGEERVNIRWEKMVSKKEKESETRILREKEERKKWLTVSHAWDNSSCVMTKVKQW